MRQYLKEAVLKEASQTAIMRAGLKMGGSFGLWNHSVMTGEHQLAVLKGFVDGLRKVGYDDFAIAMYGDWTDGRHMGDSFEGIIDDWDKAGQKHALDKLIAEKTEKDARPVNEVRATAQDYIKDLNISTKVEFRNELKRHYGVKESFRERLTKLSELSPVKSRFKEARHKIDIDASVIADDSQKDSIQQAVKDALKKFDKAAVVHIEVGDSWEESFKELTMPHIKEPNEAKFPRGAYSKAINAGTSYGVAVQEIGTDIAGMMDEWVENEPVNPTELRQRINKVRALSTKLDSSVTDKRLKFHKSMDDLLAASEQSVMDANKGGK